MQGCSCSCPRSSIWTHTPNFGLDTDSILATIKQTCIWKMDLILTFGFFLYLLLRIGLEKYDPHCTSKLFSLSRAGIAEFFFSVICHLCFVGAVSKGALPMQEEGNYYLRKRINMDSKSRKSLEIYIRNVSVIKWPILDKGALLNWAMAKGTHDQISEGVTMKERQVLWYRILICFSTSLLWDPHCQQSEAFSSTTYCCKLNLKNLIQRWKWEN